MVKKAKLLLFSHLSSSRSITGAEKLLLFICRKLTPYFHCVLVAPQEGKLTERARSLGITTRIHGYPVFYGMYTPHAELLNEAARLRESSAYDSIAALIRAESPDLVLTNTCVNLLPAMAAASSQIPVIWNITEAIALNEFTPQTVSLIDQYSQWITGISETSVSSFRACSLDHKISLVYPSWDAAEVHPELWPRLREEKRNQYGIKPEHRLIGYISSYLTPEKGFDHFIHMALSLCTQEPNVRFLIIGRTLDRDYFSDSLAQVNASEFSSRFNFIVFEEHVEAAYCAMDMVVIPSVVPEGFGMTALEAMSYGKPVAAYASGGLQEILEAVGSGDSLAAPGDLEGLTARVTALLENPDLTAEASARNLEKVNEIFGPSAYEQRLRQMLIDWSMQQPGLIKVHDSPEGMYIAAVMSQGTKQHLPRRRRSSVRPSGRTRQGGRKGQRISQSSRSKYSKLSATQTRRKKLKTANDKVNPKAKRKAKLPRKLRGLARKRRRKARSG